VPFISFPLITHTQSDIGEKSRNHFVAGRPKKDRTPPRTGRSILLLDCPLLAAVIGQEQIISASAGSILDKSLAIKKSLWNNPVCFTH
jgi:hypothetical protein